MSLLALVDEAVSGVVVRHAVGFPSLAPLSWVGPGG